MEGPALEEIRAATLQAPKAHPPSLPSWRREGSPQTPETSGRVLVGQVPGRRQGDPGQPRQEDGRSGRGGFAHPRTKAEARRGHVPEGREGQAPAESLDTQTGLQRRGEEAPGYTGHARPGAASVGETRLGARMGSQLRAQQLRLQTGTLLPRRDRHDPSCRPPQAEVRPRRGHRQMLRAHQPRGAPRKAVHLPDSTAGRKRLAKGGDHGRRGAVPYRRRHAPRRGRLSAACQRRSARARRTHKGGLPQAQGRGVLATPRGQVRRRLLGPAPRPKTWRQWSKPSGWRKSGWRAWAWSWNPAKRGSAIRCTSTTATKSG